MSVYFVAQWSVRQSAVEPCERALNKVADHIKQDHPSIKSVQVFRQAWGPYASRAYCWLEEYESVTAMGAERSTQQWMEVWKPIEAMAQDGTYRCSIWDDPHRSIWFSRELSGTNEKTSPFSLR